MKRELFHRRGAEVAEIKPNLFLSCLRASSEAGGEKILFCCAFAIDFNGNEGSQK